MIASSAHEVNLLNSKLHDVHLGHTKLIESG